jgi:hypothetical protein
MSEMTRDEFMEASFGRVHRLDVRATIGRLTLPSPDVAHPQFKASDVAKVLEGMEMKKTAWFYHVGKEIGYMTKLGMLKCVNYIPTTRNPGGGAYYERREESGLAKAGWKSVEDGALTVAELYPDDPRNRTWMEFATALSDQQPTLSTSL